MSGPSRDRAGGETGLAGLVTRIRHRMRRSALVAAGSWIGVLVAFGLVVAWLLGSPAGWRRGSPVPLVMDLILVLSVGVGVVVLWRLVARWFDDSRIAREMDTAGGLGRGTVLGALELSRDFPVGVSSSLAQKAENRVLEALPSDPESLTGSLGEATRRWSRRGAAVLLAAVALLGVLAVMSPQRAFSAWGGLLRPAEVMGSAALPLRVVEPIGDSLPRGSEILVAVEAPGRDRIRVAWQFDGDVTRERELPVEEGVASASLGVLEVPMEYRFVAADGAATQRRRIVPVDPLLLTELRLELLFPEHTGMAPRQIGRDVSPLEIPAGTRIRFRGRASRSLQAVSLHRAADGADDGTTAESGGPEEAEAGGETPVSGDGSEARSVPGEPTGEPVVELDVDENRFSGEWRPGSSGRFAWRLEAGSGSEGGTAPAPLEVSLVPDSAPSVELLFPGRDTVLPLDRRQPLVIQARDDYGIAALELVARRSAPGGQTDEPVVQDLRAGGVRAAMARPVLDLSTWSLVPGDTVRYRVRVQDNAPRPRTAQTREYVLRVPRRSESARAVQEELESVTERLDSLRSEAGRTARETRDLERRGVQQERQSGDARSDDGQTASGARSSEEEASFQAREGARQALQQQEGLMSRVDSVRSELEQIRRALEEGVLAEPELRRDLEELESLMEEAAPEEMRREAREMSEDVGEMDARELEEALDRMAESQEELRQRIEESMDEFRRVATEQDLRANAQEARELAREEEALADALESGDRSEQRARQQEELSERARRLQQEMEDLEQGLDEMGEETARQGAQRAGERSEAAAGTMERTTEMLQRGEQGRTGQQAGDSARSAYQDLEQAADDLDQARQEMSEGRENAQRQAYRQTASEALALARRQAEIQERMGSRDPQEQARNQGDQAAVLEGIQNMEQNLQESGGQQSESEQGVRQSVEQARQSVQQVLRSMQDPSGDQPSPSAASNEAVEALNEVARSASESSQRQQGGGQQSQQSSGGQTGQQLQELARRQAGISDQSGALQSMQLGRESLEPRLRQIAGEQGRLGRELGQLAVQPGSDGQVLGDLRALAREARNLARDLEGGRLDGEMVRRQERLFHRLLDAGRSLEKDETSTERESRTAESQAGPEVESLTIQEMGGPRFPLPDSEVLQGLSPAQRALVLQYFERLNGSEAPASVPEGEAVGGSR